MLPAFLLLALSLLPDAGCVSATVDCVERNSVLTYIEPGLFNAEEVRESIAQVIFWSHDAEGRPVVREWRIDKGQFVFSPGEVTWTEHGTNYRVRFGTLRQTAGWDDPERENLAVCPDERRVKLGGARK